MPDLSALLPRLWSAPLPRAAAEIDLGFKDWSAWPQTWEFLKNLGLAALAALVLWFLARAVARRVRAARENIPGHLAAEARRVLQAALDQRSKVEVSMGTGKSAPCSILSLGPGEVKLEAPAYTRLTRDAVVKTAECFFRIAAESPGEQWDFYRFRGRIVSLLPGRDQSLVLTLTLPEQVDSGQKRHFYRLSPPRSLVPRLAAWPGSLAETPLSGLPRPPLKFQADRTGRTHLANISAGGLLLDGDHRELEGSGLPLEPGSDWLFLISVQDPANEERLDWWLTARLVNRKGGNPGRTELAFRLTGFADAMAGGLPAWEPIPEDGVEAIASWVFLRSMELAREGKSAA